MALLLVVLPFMPSCTQVNVNIGPEPQVELKLEVPNSRLGKAAGSQFVYVSASADWELSVVYEGEAEGWISLSPSSGNACEGQGILFKWESNSSQELRTAQLVLICEDATAAAKINQAGTGGSSSGSEIKPDPVPGWLELPATDDENLYFITHDMTVGTTYSGRNYSIYYDADNLISRWVAYPLNKGLISSGSRTDAWGFDPKIPADKQPALFSGFRNASDGRRYDRGHQLPSADRLQKEANEATFYGTNMTPQLSDLNQKCWASLESAVRSWSYSFDTLYVVTGADVRGARDYCTDNYGRKVTIPTGYYKVLLGYKKGGQFAGMASTGGYTGIAFYFDHKSYTDSRETIMGQAMSIDALEDDLEIDFFVNLPSKIGVTFAAKVESTVDNWWYKK